MSELSKRIQIIDVRKGHHRVSKEGKKVIKDLSEQGMRIADIAKVIGCTSEAIKYHLDDVTRTKRRLRYVLSRKLKDNGHLPI